jgi:hypothetical protein
MSKLITAARRYRIHAMVVLANVVFAATFVTIALEGFHQPSPHRVPVGVVAPAPVEKRLQQGLDAKVPSGFRLEPVSSAGEVRYELSRRDIDGALIAGPKGMSLLTAEAAGNSPTQTLTNVFTEFAAKSHTPLTVTDVVPTTSGDAQGLSSFFLILCVLFPSLATGVAVGHALRRSPLAARLGVLVAVAGIAGLAAAGIGDGISNLGHYWPIAGIVGLFSLAISAPTAALGQIKPHLSALCVLVFLVFGIPVSGGPANLAMFGPSFLRSLFSGLPLGIGADSIRNTVYFHAAHTSHHLWVLTSYAIGGLALLSILALATEHMTGWRARRVSRAIKVAAGR